MMKPPPHTRALLVDLVLKQNSGVTQVLLTLARYRDHERLSLVFASMFSAQKALVPLLAEQDVAVHSLGNRSIHEAARKLKSVVRTEGVQVVVANSFRTYLTSKLATVRSGVPVVFWIHTVNQIETSPLKARLFRTLTRRDTLLYVSRAVKENNHPPGHRGRSAVIYNAVEPPEAKDEWRPYSSTRRPEYGLPAGATVLGYVANMVDYKDHRTLIEGFAALAARDPDLHLMLVGDGPLLGQLRAQVAALECADRIHFLGMRVDARALLGLVDIYVHPSPEEAFGVAVVEAMLAGRPVVAARSCALPELIDDGATGLLFEPHNPADLARQVTTLLDDPARAHQLACAADESARRRFAPQRLATELSALLSDTVHSAAAPRSHTR